MPPASRRKKKYEQQLRTFQNRNVFAGLALLIAVVGAVWLAIYLVPPKRPTVFLRTNMIDHSGSKEIPLAQESCELILKTFRDRVDKVLLNWEDTHELDHKDSSLGLPEEEISDKDVLVVYLNGHLVSQENESEPVAFLVPEVDGEIPPQDLGELLEQIKETKAGLKILLLDAGRFTSSPVYPARQLNEFNSALSKALKKDAWGDLGENLWIIVSHEDHEVSRVSTPLKSSLFAKAFTESIEEYANNEAEKISVFDLFQQIRKRTTSWSRNFKGFSTQHPVLMRSGYGRVDPADRSKPDWYVRFNQPPEPDQGQKTKSEPGYRWTEQFASAQSGALATKNLLADHRYDAIPLDTIRQLEGFLELGSPINPITEQIANYRKKFKKSREEPEEDSRSDMDRLNEKQETVLKFRESVLGLSLFERFQNELRHWEDDSIMSFIGTSARGSIPTLQPVGKVRDDALTHVADTPASYQDFTSQFGDYQKMHSALIARVNSKLEQLGQSLRESADASLTPTQAEMLGRVSQRYLPLLAGFAPQPKTDPQDKPKKSGGKFGLNLSVEDSTSKFGSKTNCSVADLYSASSSRAGMLSGDDDTSFRFLLAAVGSENLHSRPGVVPAIKWQKIKPQIFLSTEPNSAFRLNPSDLDPINLQVSADATELVKLSVEFGDGELPTELDTMEFGFDPVNFKKLHSVSIPASEPVKLYVKYSNPVGLEKWIGKEVPFVITARDSKAQDGKAKEEQITIPVVFIRDPVVQIIAKRELGASGSQSVMESSLVRWGAMNLPSQWRPLMIKSFGNIESKFTFWLKNNSSTSKSLSFTLYNITKSPGQAIRSDLTDKKSIEQLARWLANRMEQQPSAATIDLPQKYFKTLATADSVTFESGEENQVEFKAWVAEGQNAESQELPDKILNRHEVDKGMLLVGRDNDGKLAWFQWVGFEPQEAADGTSNLASSGSSLLKLQPDILDVFQKDPADDNQTFTTRALLKDLWPAPGFAKEEPAARLTSVPADGGLPNQATHQNTLTLDSLMDGQELSKKTDLVGKHLLIVDLFGVSGYRLLSQDDGRITRSFEKDQLAGIRVKPGTLPGQWKCHPKTWSLFGFGEERTGGLPTKTVFIHKPETDDTNQSDVKLKFEFLLPRRQGEVLGSAEQNFEVRFNGGRKNLTFPNNRTHFIRTQEDGLSFFTHVAAHGLVEPSSNFSDGNELTIFDKQQNKEIAKWKFQTSSSEKKPRIAVDSRQGSNAMVTLDVSQLQPPIDISNVSVLVGKRELDDPEKFLSGWRDGTSGKFKFSWQALAENLELETKPGPYRIQLVAKDFFGKEHSDSARMTIKPPRKIEKPKQKKITKRTSFIKLRLIDSNGKTLDVKEIVSIQVDQRDEEARLDGKQIKLYGLRLGKHNVRIAVKVQSEKIANGRDKVAIEADIEVKSDKQVISVTGP